MFLEVGTDAGTYHVDVAETFPIADKDVARRVRTILEGQLVGDIGDGDLRVLRADGGGVGGGEGIDGNVDSVLFQVDRGVGPGLR
jgi:hypothetical protein